MKITFLDGSSKEFETGSSAFDIAKSISPSLAKKSIYALVNDKTYDLTRPIEEDAKLELKMVEDAFEVLNHSCSHLLATAVKRLYPQAKFGVGPAIEEGFYYDIDPGEGIKLTEKDLYIIENQMRKIVKENQEFKRIEVTRDAALEKFSDDEYKHELISELTEGEIITMYQNGDFIDLCRGPHVPSTKDLKHFKLLKVSGAYWRGDSDNKQLQRIYGVCFPTAKKLKDHLELLKEREKRDHRKLGRQLDLFMISEYGPGFPFWLPNGMIIRKALEDLWYKVHFQEGYKLIQTPIMLNRELWEISGHWENYRENMYTSTIDNREFVIKPMNCPGGILAYKNGLHSYKDLPLRIGELGLVHRHEASGALSGLFRVRNFTQDDAHIFMREGQIVSEIIKLLELFDKFYQIFGLEYNIELSTRPEKKYIGDIKVWDSAEAALAEACDKIGKEYKLNPGDGAFYGPKLDFKLKDSMNRVWQCGTIQLDINLPERFDIAYIDKAGQRKRPIMLHRAIFGSLERFIGILIEHYGGAFPLWMTPMQVVLIPVNNEYHLDYVKELFERMHKIGIRVKLDDRSEKLGYKIRDAQTKKIPYQLVIGDEELKDGKLTIRKYGEKATSSLDPDEFIKMVKGKIDCLENTY